MKIAAITASSIPASTANSIQVMKTCQSLTQLGHDLQLFAPSFGNNKPNSFDELKNMYGLMQPFPIHWIKSRPRLKRYDFALNAIRQIAAMKVDLVYCWPIQAALAARLFGQKVLLEMHGPPEGHIGPLLFSMFVRMPGVKRLIFITHALRRMVEKNLRLRLPNDAVVVAPNGVELDRYQSLPGPSVARKAIGLPEKFTAVYSGHLYPGRGMELLAGLAERFPEVQFIWAGGNPADITRWRDRLTEREILNINLLGFIPNTRVPEIQSAADVLLMPYERIIAGSSGGNSADYCSPMKMFEYMASRRPIISSDLPVLREILSEQNALLCPPEDIDAWSEGLTKLFDDPNLRFSLANQAWMDVQRLSWLERAKKTLEGLERIENNLESR